MGFRDLILFPLFVYIFHLIFSARRKKIKDPVLKKYHLVAFWVKIFATMAAVAFNLSSPGDSITLYFPEGLNIFQLILHDPSHIKWLLVTGDQFDLSLTTSQYTEGYFRSESNFFVIRLVAILSFFCFGSYAVVSLFFSMFALTGIWKLFVFFYDLYPDLHKQLAIAVLFLPTVVFWSSGVLKDPICMGALGWLTYSINHAIYKKQHVARNVVIAICSSWILSIVKPYILYSFLPLLILYLVLANIYLIKNPLTKFITILAIAIFGIAGSYYLSNVLQKEMGDFSSEKLSIAVQMQQSNFLALSDHAESSFSLGVEYDGSTGSLLRTIPAAVNATLFRPYLWESKKISTLLSSIESLSLMLFTLFVLFKAGPILFFKTIFANPMVMFCFFFSIIFAIFIGATTLNFGTLVRYKIPCMPFFIIALILINQRRKVLQATKMALKTAPLNN